MADLQINVDTDSRAAVSGLDDVAAALTDVSTKASSAAGDLDQTTSRVDSAAGAADNMATKTGTLTGAMGALAGGLAAVGMEDYAARLEGAAIATDFASGASDVLSLALQSNAVKTAAAAVKTGVLTVATTALRGAQAALNLVMRANPIGLVITAIALLVAGIITAYKNSETFRRIVDGAFRAIANAGRWMWDTVLKPVFSALLRYVGFVLDAVGRLLEMLGNVPGFGWVGDLGTKARQAADKVNGLADELGRVDGNHTANVRTPGLSNAVGLSQQLLNNLSAAASAGADVGASLGRRAAGTAAASSSRTAAPAGPSNTANISVQGALDPVAVARQIIGLLRAHGFLVTGTVPG